MTATTTEREGLVEVHGVHKSYGTLEVLSGVDLVVKPGEVTVVIGPSGSGKSTLLRVINHLEKVDRGFVAIDGDLIGYARKGDTLRELKEKDILVQRTRIGFVFQSFNLFPHLTALENVVEAPVSAQGRPRAEVEGEVLDVIKDLAHGGTTMVVVTHEIGFAREVADTVVFMDAGRIVEQGPPAQVLEAPRHDRTRAFLDKVL